MRIQTWIVGALRRLREPWDSIDAQITYLKPTALEARVTSLEERIGKAEGRLNETRPPRDEVVTLIRAWKTRARKKFEDAQHEKDAMGKKLIEHGAMCYCNAATELEALLSKPSKEKECQA